MEPGLQKKNIANWNTTVQGSNQDTTKNNAQHFIFIPRPDLGERGVEVVSDHKVVCTGMTLRAWSVVWGCK